MLPLHTQLRVLSPPAFQRHLAFWLKTNPATVHRAVRNRLQLNFTYTPRVRIAPMYSNSVILRKIPQNIFITSSCNSTIHNSTLISIKGTGNYKIILNQKSSGVFFFLLWPNKSIFSDTFLHLYICDSGWNQNVHFIFIYIQK